MSIILQRLRNISSNYAAVGVHALIVIVLTPFVVHELGTASYAVWVLVQAIAYYLGFLDLGIVDAQIRRHAVLAAKGSHVSLGRLHGTVLTLLLGAGIVALVLATLISLLPSAALFDVPTGAREAFAWTLRLIGLASFLEASANGVFEGCQRYDLMNAVEVTVAVVGAIATFLALYLGYGLIGLVIVRVAESGLAACIKLIAARRLLPSAARPSFGFDMQSWREIRGFSIWNSLNDIVTEGTAQLDKLLIPILLASALLTPYSLIVTIAAVVFVVAEPITDTVFPLAASRHGKDDTVALGVLLTRTSRLVNTMTIPTTIVLLCFGMPILDLWIGAEYTNVPVAVLWFTVLNFYLSTHFWTALAILMGIGRVKRIFLVSVVEVGIILVLILALVPSFGLSGLALAGLIGNALIGFACFIAEACKLTGVKLAPFLWRTIVLPLFAGLPALSVGVWLEQNIGLDSWFVLAGCVAATGSCGLLCVVWVTTSRWDRARYFATARRLLAPVSVGG
jgi:O-antigen/teichoic acid export membrane protein